jgi:N-alpha-acetyltransferase 35, NatC auxiliary subunit
MDSGFLEEGDDLEDDFDFSQPLSPEQVVWLMDELVCREVRDLCNVALRTLNEIR